MNELFLNPDNLLLNLTLAFIFALLISFLSYRLKFLSKSGALAQFILAFLVFGFGGVKWTLPILVFFILSSVLTKFRRNIKKSAETYFEKSTERDYMQVAANGGIGAILVVISFFFEADFLYLFYVSFIAAVCADTWGTEIGTLLKTKTIDITSLRKVEQGVSGGISVPGTAGALAGAMAVASVSLIWIETDKIVYFVLITAAGFLGSIADSFCGSLVQAQYKCFNCGRLTENKVHCGLPGSFFRGCRFINNDAVNFFAGFTGGIFSMVFNRLILNPK